MIEKLMIRLFRWWPLVLMLAAAVMWKVCPGDQTYSVVFLTGFVSWLIGGIGALVERDYMNSRQSGEPQ